MEKGSIMLDREASSLPQLVGKYVVLSSYHFFLLYLPLHESLSMQMTSSVSGAEYSITFILSLFYIIKLVRVIAKNLENTNIEKKIKNHPSYFHLDIAIINILVYFHPVLVLSPLSYAFHFYVILKITTFICTDLHSSTY